MSQTDVRPEDQDNLDAVDNAKTEAELDDAVEKAEKDIAKDDPKDDESGGGPTPPGGSDDASQ